MHQIDVLGSRIEKTGAQTQISKLVIEHFGGGGEERTAKETTGAMRR